VSIIAFSIALYGIYSSVFYAGQGWKKVTSNM
jgi:hypothetical protein